MSILTIILVIVIVGILLWLVNSYVPMDQKIKTILNVVVIIILVIWLLKASGIWAQLGSVKV